MDGGARTGSAFARELARRNPDPRGRRWLFVPYDQLSARIGPLAREDPAELGIVVVEGAPPAPRPSGRERALRLSNLRWFALEQAARGVAVRPVVPGASYAGALEGVAREVGPLRVMRPAEPALRAGLRPLLAKGVLVETPHEGWLTTPEQFRASQAAGPPDPLDAFYRFVRRASGVLMREGRPVGGRYRLGGGQRRPAAAPPRFATDEIKAEAAASIARDFVREPRGIDPSEIPATAADAERLWAWAKAERLAGLGAREAGTPDDSPDLHRFLIAQLLELHRLLPARAVAEAEGLDAPLASREAFIRRVLGEREFLRHAREQAGG